MPAKGWKSVSIPDDLYAAVRDFIRRPEGLDYRSVAEYVKDAVRAELAADYDAAVGEGGVKDVGASPLYLAAKKRLAANKLVDLVQDFRSEVAQLKESVRERDERWRLLAEAVKVKLSEEPVQPRKRERR